MVAAGRIFINRGMMGTLDAESAQAVGLSAFHMMNLFELHLVFFYTRHKSTF